MIVLDIQALQSAAYARRGVGRHVGDLVRALFAAHPDVVDVFAWNDRFDRGAALDALDAELGLGERLRPFAALRGTDVDVVHVPAPFSPLARAAGEANDWVEMAVPVRARRLVVTLHDLIPWRFPDRYLADVSDHARYQSRLAMLLAADQVLAVSRSAADDAVELVGVDRRRLTVVGAGPSAGFQPSDEPLDTTMQRLQRVVPEIEPGFVAVSAATDWRKNLESAVAAYARLTPEVRRDHQLVVVADLDRSQVDHITLEGAELGIGDQLLVPGFIDDDVLLDLYRAADLVVVPSRYEGFGLPVVEARACGARVICSDVSSLPEVLPEARARFDPDDIRAMAEMIAQALGDDDFRAVLDSVPPAPYDWSSAADGVVATYARCTSQPRRAAHSRARLAVVTVTPPTASGVADHSARLIEAIAGDAVDVDVEVFTPGGPRRLDRAPAVEVRHLAALPERVASGTVDEVVYCIGNDSIHRPLFDMMRAVPGHVLLHDVRIPRLYGPEGPPEGAIPDADAGFLSTPVASVAVSRLVQSEHAGHLLREVSGFDSIDVGPHPCWNDGTVDPIDDGESPWIVSVGIAHELKQTDVFVAAMRHLFETTSIRAAVVGPGGSRFVGDSDVIATEHVDDAAFDAWLRKAAIAVQLRATTNGESSGAVANVLARGVPLIVTDIGAMAELPDDVAVRVPVDVTPEQLADEIAALLRDPAERARMRSAALTFAGRESATAQALRIVDAVRSGAGVRG